eukprot:RCo000405
MEPAQVKPSKINTAGQMIGAMMNSLDIASGANDIIVVRSKDGTLRSSAFAVRFGRFKCTRRYDKVVLCKVNGVLNSDVYLKIGDAGEAFFIEETTGPVPPEYETSPLGSPRLSSESGLPSAGATPLESPQLNPVGPTEELALMPPLLSPLPLLPEPEPEPPDLRPTQLLPALE